MNLSIKARQRREALINSRGVLERQEAQARDALEEATALAHDLIALMRTPSDPRCVAAAALNKRVVEDARRAEGKLKKIQQELEDVRREIPLWEGLSRE